MRGTQTHGFPTAELTWGMILAYQRSLVAEVNSLAGGGWQTAVGRGVRGKTLGIFGYGRIGGDVAPGPTPAWIAWSFWLGIAGTLLAWAWMWRLRGRQDDGRDRADGTDGIRRSQRLVDEVAEFERG